MKRSMKAILSSTVLTTLIAGCSTGDNGTASSSEATESDSKKVEIEFYQHKEESVKIYDKLIAQFEAKNPDITVVQSNRPNQPEYLKSRAAANDMPDVVGVVGTAEFSSFVKGGMIKEVGDTPQADTVEPVYLDQLKALTGTKELYGYPYVGNARTILYNKKMFADEGYEIPRTWDELIQLCEQIKAKNKQPFIITYKENWMVFPVIDQLASGLAPADFLEQRLAGKTTFKSGFEEALKKTIELNKYGGRNIVELSYDQANGAFATGKAFMYMQGIWAIPSVIDKNPDIQIGSFAMPSTNNAADVKLITSIDQVLAISKNSKHPEAAQKFVDFLMEKEVSQQFVSDQRLLPTIKGVVQHDESLEDLQPMLDKGQIGASIYNQFPAGFSPDAFWQEFVMRQNVEETLSKMDKELDKVMNR